MIYQMVKGLSKMTTRSEKVLPGIIMLDFTIVNAFIVGDKEEWVLVDAGLENSYDFIIETAKEQYGLSSTPKAIILTHGHFDHIGCLLKLLGNWSVKIYAHKLELPYLTGQKDYPEPDHEVDEGLVAKMSPFFPNKGIDVSNNINELPSDGSIPGMPGWEWIHTPGHTEGHVSLFRSHDKVLIAGDAFTTTKQESLTSVITGKEKIKGPPAYLTPDWETSYKSITKLRNLQPEYVLPSHGKPMKEDKLQEHLTMLEEHFNELAVPDKVKQTSEKV